MSEQDYKKFIDKTSADPTQAGFDFQFLAYLYLILKMEANSTVGYETEDDLVYSPEDRKKQLIQVKFAVLDKEGKIPNLATRDIELWHTIHNWIKGSEALGSDDYFKTRQFSILTNKKNEGNSFFENLLLFQKGNIEIDGLDKVLKELISKTEDGDPKKPNEVKIAMIKLSQLSKKERILFYSNFCIKYFPETSIIDEIKKVLEQEKIIPAEKVDQVYNSLYSELKTDRFFETFKRNKTVIRASEFSKKYRKCFNMGFDRVLRIDRTLVGMMPDDVCSQKFVKQLLDIKIIFPVETAKMQEMTRRKMCTRLNINEFLRLGDLLHEDISELDRIAYNSWNTEFDSCHENLKIKEYEKEEVTENEYNESARRCYREITKKDVFFNGYHFDQETSIGYFYEMSDELRIGWRNDWERIYK